MILEFISDQVIPKRRHITTNSITSSKKLFWAGSIGNVLDHYDMALYTFLVPFIAPIFFKQEDTIVQLIMAYGLTAVGIFTRPIGSIFFGRLAMRVNPKTLLAITLSGVALSTAAIGIIPGYDSIGSWAIVILLIIRIVQGLFAAGEQSIASILLLDKLEEGTRTKMSSYYVASSMTGTMIASGSAILVSMSSNPEFYWRYAFISGIITGIIGLLLRFITFDSPVQIQTTTLPTYKIVNLHKAIIIKVIFVSSFSYMTYSVPFVFFNKFIPLFNDISLSEMLKYNTALLAIDILLLPVFGHIAQKYNYIKWMIACAIMLGITAIPAFYLLSIFSIYGITAIKFWIIITGIAFVIPSKVWMYNLIGGKERYLVTGLGYAIGTEILGRQTTTICWMIWYYTGSITAPAYYIVFLSAAAAIALMERKKI
jgi:MFS family permease